MRQFQTLYCTSRLMPVRKCCRWPFPKDFPTSLSKSDVVTSLAASPEARKYLIKEKSYNFCKETLPPAMKSQLLVYKHHRHTSHCQQQQFVFNSFFFHFSAWTTRLLKVKLKWHLTSREKSAREKIYRLIARFVLFEMCLRRKKEFLWNNIEQHEIIDARSLETLWECFSFCATVMTSRNDEAVVICRDTVTWTTGLRCLGPAAGLKAPTNVNLFNPMAPLDGKVSGQETFTTPAGGYQSVCL